MKNGNQANKRKVGKNTKLKSFRPYTGEFSVIKFIEEINKLFECIPDNWFVDEEKLACYWPPKTGRSFTLRAMNGDEPEEDWEIYECVVVSEGHLTYSSGFQVVREKCAQKYNTSSADEYVEAANFQRKHPGLVSQDQRCFENIFHKSTAQQSEEQREENIRSMDVQTSKGETTNNSTSDSRFSSTNTTSSVRRSSFTEHHDLSSKSKITNTNIPMMIASNNNMPTAPTTVVNSNNKLWQKRNHTSHSPSLNTTTSSASRRSIYNQQQPEQGSSSRLKTTNTNSPMSTASYVETQKSSTSIVSSSNKLFKKRINTSHNRSLSITMSSPSRHSIYNQHQPEHGLSNRLKTTNGNSPIASIAQLQTNKQTSTLNGSEKSKDKEISSKSSSRSSRSSSRSSLRSSLSRATSRSSPKSKGRSLSRGRSISRGRSSRGNSLTRSRSRSLLRGNSRSRSSLPKHSTMHSRDARKSSSRSSSYYSQSTQISLSSRTLHQPTIKSIAHRATNFNLRSSSSSSLKDRSQRFRSQQNTSSSTLKDPLTEVKNIVSKIDQRLDRIEMTANKTFIIVGDIINEINLTQRQAELNSEESASEPDFNVPNFPIRNLRKLGILQKKLKDKALNKFLIKREKEYCGPSARQTDTVVMTKYLKRFISLRVRCKLTLVEKGESAYTLFGNYNRVYQFLIDVIKAGYKARNKKMIADDAHQALRIVWGRSKQLLKEDENKNKTKNKNKNKGKNDRSKRK